MEKIALSKHAEKRAAQRGIDERQIKICLEFGEQFHRTGAMFFMITKKCLKKWHMYKKNKRGMVFQKKMCTRTKNLTVDSYTLMNVPCRAEPQELFVLSAMQFRPVETLLIRYSQT